MEKSDTNINFDNLNVSFIIGHADGFSERPEGRDMTKEADDERILMITSTLSHELRTPLNSIRGYIDVCLRSKELPSDLRNHLQKALGRSEELNSMVTDLLDLSTILGSKNLPVYPRWFDLNMILTDIEKDLEGLRRKATDTKLFMDVQDGIGPVRIRTDPDRLKQVILNLLDNAFKYTISGSVLLKVRHSNDRLFFFVEDTGIGISKDDLERIFDPFFQADPGKSRRYGGAGVGLSLSKEIVERLDGRLMVSSELGKGSKFIIEIPVRSETLSMVENLMLEIEG